MKDTIYYYEDNSLGELKGMVSRNAKDGELRVAIWSRDCDGTTGTHKTTIKATVAELVRIIEREWDDAEGPWEISFE